MDIRTFLKQERIVTDGAMGTYYDSLYPGQDSLVERENLLHPQRIEKIHLEYLKNGANLIRTNTFAANPTFFSREEREDLIAAGYQIAVSAAEKYRRMHPAREVFIAADIGTVADMETDDKSHVLEEYQGICDVFLSQGADIFLFETQSDLRYLQELASYIRSRSSEAFIIASFSFDKTGYTKAGLGLKRMIDAMCAMEEFDAYGLNCGVDCNHMYSLLEGIAFPGDKYVLALPNAGYPYMLRGRTIYGKNEQYFLSMEKRLLSLGVDIVGGCCGTTPAYIAGVRQLVHDSVRTRKKTGGAHVVDAAATHSRFWRKLQEGGKPVIAELDPPFDVNTDKIMDGANMLRSHHVDLLTLSDSPLARTRMDASILGGRIQREAGIGVMPHISCRDRNVIALRSVMLGNYMNDIKHFLIVTGDPVEQCDRNTVTQVFDYNSIKLMGMLKEMNADLFAKDRVVYGGALNYHGANADAIAHRMDLKMEQGCSYFLTQPVYGEEDVKRLEELKRRTGAKIMAGILPLVSYRNAQFLANEMPGIHIPERIVSAYRPKMDREEGEETAVSLCVEIGQQLADVADGYYFMTPFNRVSLICRIIEEMRNKQLC